MKKVPIHDVLLQGMLQVGPYKGYHGRAEYDREVDLWHGEVAGVRDVVTFQGRSPDEVSYAFLKSVDDYLALCKERGEEPEKPYSGRFVIRIQPETHAKISNMAELTGVSLNELVATRLQQLAETQFPAKPPKPANIKRVRRASKTKKPSKQAVHAPSRRRRLGPD